ncbi:dTDP-4-dehydrorhamnose reductase [Mucilaginibacter sp. PPCGB 2223]|uniref:dTDP-4-dehydrorhamnose reductase n=1 Tax=Mucilaginibacter sp. PPCGB 2223 TaxID=1886027 RepID=UPI00082613D6|nr:dTDP-4-dehydrorhamnose reductase [Mucilaginibacter sp. PPCGB 2223]OCX54539.1 dTDP-4-dehydrorhamnose reductase [Mucilaginibacter sp. PPCGB 2223]
MSKVLVFGASGQLGQCLNYVAGQKGITGIIFPSEAEANILDIELLTKLFAQHKPGYCINCAAYTAVDKAEDDVDMARKINRDGAENIAKLCAQFGVTMIHVSTDFVFEGNTAHPLVEDDIAEPVNIYGLTKLEGEQAISAVLREAYILRTSWLYSEYGNNFVKTMMRLGNEKDELRIIADQIGTPTYAIDLADCILNIITNDKQRYGIYHFSNEGVTSWYDFAMGIFDIAKINVKVYPVRTSEYVTRAIRPAFSVMDKSKIKKDLGIEIPYWRASLEKCISVLLRSN